MPLLIGTDEGVSRTPADEVEPADRSLDGTEVRRLRSFDAVDGVFAATEDGLYRSTDGGSTWTDLGVPEAAVVSVLASPDGRTLYAGTRPAHVYVSRDGGDAWERSEAFAGLPGRQDWRNLGPVGPQVRALAADPGAPGTVLAGVEAAGLYASDDAGRTWQHRATGLNDDVHHLLALGDGEFVASCGRGCYRTRDAGRSWTALDTGADLFWFTYFREAFERDGVLYASAQDRSEARHREAARGLLLESRDGGRRFRRMAFPGSAEDYVNAWAAPDGRVVAGTVRGRVLVREADGWTGVGRVPGSIRSLLGVPAGPAPER